ncbi:MAG: phage tail protein [Methylobacter sp.]
MAFITTTGENQIAAKQGASQILDITHFVLANIAGLGTEPVNRIEAMPDVGDIVATLAVTAEGYVNTNQVVYSLVMDSSLGDYDFNWVGLKDADGVLIAVTYTPLIQKRKTAGAVPGNNLTRNFLIAYSGIQATTAIDVPAATWQIDFNARLWGIDERERLSNYDIYGHEAFLATGWKVQRVGATTTYDVLPGVGYVGGVRIASAITQQVTVAGPPKSIWLDVSLQGDISDVSAVADFIIDAAAHTDYTDNLGFKHYVTKIADIAADGSVTDVRADSQYATKIGVQGSIYSVANASGTANAITGSYTPKISDLSHGMTLCIRSTSANTSTTPTFTPNGVTIPAKYIVKGNDLALAPNDIAGAGHWISLQYDSTLDKWVLQNPANGVTAGKQTRTAYTSGSGTYTKPAGCTALRVRLIGAGGGAQAAANSTWPITVNSTQGGHTTFGSALLQAQGGPSGLSSGSGTSYGGSINIPATPPGTVPNGGQLAQWTAGASGGNTLLGYGGNGGGASAVGYGGGGGGGYAQSTALYPGAAGWGGGYCEAFILNPAATYSYAVGAPGSGSIGGAIGPSNASGGIIIIDEFY